MSVAAKTWSPEVELLLCCARTHMRPKEADRLEEVLQHEIEWPLLLLMADKHGLLPLLFWHLNAASSEAVPRAILDQLRGYFNNHSRHNLILTRELLRILSVFEAHGISAIPYKGPVLAAFIYGNIALRTFSDLDLLVREQDVMRAKELLISEEYQPYLQLTRAQEAIFLPPRGEYRYAREGYEESLIDLHWRVTERYFSFRIEPDHLWGRLERRSLGGDTILTLSPEDLLLILCVHGAKHLWERLFWICDVAELIRACPGIDWERLIERATTLGSRRMLFLGLCLAGDLLSAPLPKEILQRIQADPKVKALAGQVNERLFLETDPDIIFGGSRFQPFHLRVRERWRDKIRYCVGITIFVPLEDWMLLPLPAYLYPLYHVIRPVLLTLRFTSRSLKRLFYNRKDVR